MYDLAFWSGLRLLYSAVGWTGDSAADIWYYRVMNFERSSLEDWTPQQVADAKRWIQAWKEAGEAMELLRRQELRQLDSQRSIALLCGPADYRVAPRAPKPTSGLIEQQFWFKKAAGRE